MTYVEIVLVFKINNLFSVISLNAQKITEIVKSTKLPKKIDGDSCFEIVDIT